MLPGFPHAEPLAGLAGGILIGLAAAVMLLGSGRIAGVSGIFARATGVASSSLPHLAAWAFVLGLPVGALVVMALNGPLSPSFMSLPWIAVAGLVVGVGTRLGSGCTSGHGVCGVSRLSPRSLVATLTFMATGIATVAIVNALN